MMLVQLSATTKVNVCGGVMMLVQLSATTKVNVCGCVWWLCAHTT